METIGGQLLKAPTILAIDHCTNICLPCCKETHWTSSQGKWLL